MRFFGFLVQDLLSPAGLRKTMWFPAFMTPPPNCLLPRSAAIGLVLFGLLPVIHCLHACSKFASCMKIESPSSRRAGRISDSPTVCQVLCLGLLGLCHADNDLVAEGHASGIFRHSNCDVGHWNSLIAGPQENLQS